MKIKNVSCTQFAGVNNREVSFDEGINVIYGKNESGKSTLVNLISKTLFQNSRLDRRSDKDFFELYFPGIRKGNSVTGDFADGKITIETENGIYTLTKEWGTDARCMLSTPEGVIRDQSTIDDMLKDILLYGEGVYSDMLFSSQKNTDASLQTILDASKKTDAKQEITDAVSKAFAESDGISIDAIEQAINAKIDDIAGKHWDFEREVPVRKAGRWSNGLGEILKSYYILEDAKTVLDEISRLEFEADRTAKDYTDRDTAVKTAEEAYNRFNAFASRLAVQSERRKSIERIEKELEKIKTVLAEWPNLSESIEKAKALQSEKTSRELLDKYEYAKKINDELTEISALGNDCICPTDTEIQLVKTAQRNLNTLENKLCGMNLTASINMLGNNKVKVVSLRTGEEIDVSGGNTSITEAVRVIVPEVIEMQLSPADVDVDYIEAQLVEQKNIIDSIFSKYKVEAVEALESIVRDFADAKIKADSVKMRLDMLLNGITYAELEASVKTISGIVRSKEEIDRDAIIVCAGDISRFITSKETIATGYISEYGSIEALKAKAFDLENELIKAKVSISGLEDIPAEFLSISDPESHLESLKNDLKFKQTYREMALTAKTSAVSKLEAYKESASDNPASDVERARRTFEEQKELLSHWLHISQIFKELKEGVNDNPMQDIAEHFTEYLGIISGGKISSEFPEADKLSMNIYSDNKLLDYNKLSEGTKETVSLAFRLAVLDHLFPDGGGVIVFDDPFTDMDAERTLQSCELIKECARRHQVIFLTCKEEYLGMLNGNNILL